MQLNKLKPSVKNQTGVTLRINIKMFEGNNLPNQLLLRTRQKIKLRNTFENNMPADIRLSKTQISKIIESGSFLGALLSKISSPLMEIVAQLITNISALLGITAAASVIDAGIQKEINGSGITTLIT